MASDADYKRDYYRRRRNRIIQVLGGRCVRCFNDNFSELEIDHIEPTGWGKGRGRFERLSEWMQAIQQTPTNIEILCYECHVEKSYKERAAVDQG